jgi:glycosyltransferase involved in cell wall biosynthesis
MGHAGEDWCPKVTALVPCYKSADFVGRTLDCLAAQTWRNLEILIGEDKSPDDTLAVVRAFAASRPNVRVLERETNLGWLRNSNDLMAHATGELMFFAFHDDLYASDYVEKLVAALRRSPQAIMAFSDVELTELDGTRRRWDYVAMDGVSGSFANAMVMGRKGPNWAVPNRGLFRAEAFRRIGGIKPNHYGEYSADWTWLLHMALLGDFVRVPEVLCEKFYKPGSISRQWSKTREQNAALRRAGVRVAGASELPAHQRLLLMASIRWSPQLRSIRKTLRRAISN